MSDEDNLITNNGDSFPFNDGGAVTYSYVYPAFVRFQAPNKRIAVEPFPSQSLTKEIKGGLLVLTQQSGLTPLRVIHGNDRFTAGQTVYLRASRAIDSTWGKEIFTLEDQRFIFIPEEEILLVDRTIVVPGPTP